MVGLRTITSVRSLYGGYPEGVSYSILLMNLLFLMMIDHDSKSFGGGAVKRLRIYEATLSVYYMLITTFCLAFVYAYKGYYFGAYEKDAEEQRNGLKRGR